jgi:hypothetical protein
MNNPCNIQEGDEITLAVDGNFTWNYEHPTTKVREPFWYKVSRVDEEKGFFNFCGLTYKLDPKKYHSSWEWVKKVVQYKVDQEVDDDEELL